MPGMQIQASNMAIKMIEHIKTKHERYVPWNKMSGKGGNRHGNNQYINIVEYFRKHFN
jgi:hypothetical protein